MFWRILTILSLLLATGLGFLIFGSSREAPIGLHALFLLLVVLFLVGLLHKIRLRIEHWIESHAHRNDTHRDR